MSKIGPFNRLMMRLSDYWSCLESKGKVFGSRFTLVSLFSNVGILKSPRLLRFLSRRLDHKEYGESAELLQITDNSSLLYYSKSTGKYLPRIRLWDFAIPAVVLLKSPLWIGAYGYVFMCFMLQPSIISASRLFVVRADLIPHMEAVMFHKVGITGTSRVEIVPIKNLVRILPEHSKHSFYFRYAGGANLIFKDTQSTEEYAFEPNGTWIDENLKHSLIV
jgi:hypothetical protein